MNNGVRLSAVLIRDLAGLEALVDQRAAALMNEVKVYCEIQARLNNVPPAEPAITEAGARAARTVVESPGGQEGLLSSFMRSGAQRR